MNEADANYVNTSLTSAFHILIHIFHSVIKIPGLRRIHSLLKNEMTFLFDILSFFHGTQMKIFCRKSLLTFFHTKKINLVAVTEAVTYKASLVKCGRKKKIFVKL